MHRRDFLRHGAAISGGAMTGALMSADELLWAIEPIVRTGGARFKFGLAGYSYRELLTGSSPKLSLTDFIADCARLPLDGTELTSYYFPTPVTHEYLLARKQQCAELGLEVSGTAVGNDFGYAPGIERDKDIADVKRWVDHAAVLGAPVIRIFAGHVHDTTEAEAHKLIVSAIEECCEYAGQQGIKLALENHGGPTSTAEGTLALVHDVQSPWFGVNLDTGNFHSDDIYGDLAKLVPYSVNVQVKVTVTGPDGKKRPSDFQRLASMLRDAGYQGYIVLEYEESGDPRRECSKYVKKMRAAFA